MRSGRKPKGGGSRFEVGDDGSVKERANATPQKKGDEIGRRGKETLRISLRREAAGGGGERRRRQRPAATKWS